MQTGHKQEIANSVEKKQKQETRYTLAGYKQTISNNQ